MKRGQPEARIEVEVVPSQERVDVGGEHDGFIEDPDHLNQRYGDHRRPQAGTPAAYAD
jgi:hypothetical protein